MLTYLRDVSLAGPGSSPDAAPTTLTIRDGSIIGIGESARPVEGDQVIELEGRTAVPGLVNAHDHLYSHELRDPLPGWDLAAMRRWLDDRDVPTTLTTMLRTALHELASGITTIRDLGARHGLNTHLATMLGPSGLLGPTIVAAGRPIVMTGGHVWGFGREADGPWDGRRAVREQIKAGATVIKIMASGGLSHYPAEDFGLPQFHDEELRAIVDESHRRGVATCAHAFGPEAVHRAVEAGVDTIEHGVDIRDDTLELMARRDTGYVPTLANMRRIASDELNQRAGVPERAAILTEGVTEPHARTFRRAVDAGVPIGVGTDSTGTYHEELEAMMELGLDLPAILQAATSTGADICRQRTGRIEVGYRADLALYDHLPKTVAHLLAPELVCVAGDLTATDGLRAWTRSATTEVHPDQPGPDQPGPDQPGPDQPGAES